MRVMSTMQWMIYRSLLVLFGFAFWMNPWLVSGQSEYSGDYTWGDLQGNATFTYRLVSGDTVFNGPFQMEHSEIDSSYQGDNYFLVEGNYTEGVPTSGWTLQFGQFQPTGSIRLEDSQFRMQLDGVLHSAKGELVEGKYQGKWIHEVNEIQNSLPGAQLFRSEVLFERGVSQLALQIESGQDILLGRFLRNGLAHDVWTLYASEQQSEHWHFREGRLEKIVLTEGEASREVTVLPAFNGPTSIINLDPRYLSLLDVFLQLSDQDYSLHGSATAKLLHENSSYYGRIENLLFSEPMMETPVPFQVKVPYQPLNTVQISDLEKIRTNLSLIDSLHEEINTSSSINIAKVADEDISYWQALIIALSTEYLAPERLLLEYYDREILDFIPSESLWEYLWPASVNRDDLEVQYEILGTRASHIYQVKSSGQISDNPGATRDIVRTSTSVLHQIDSIRRLLYAKVESGGDIGRFAEMEEQLIEQVQMINGILDSAQVDGQAADALENIRTLAIEELTKYSAVTDIDAKEMQGTQALNCLTQCRELAEQISLIPVRWELIQVEYTDRVWNNFTSTVMSEEVKKRITGSYRDILIPYFLEKVNSDLSCTNAGHLLDAFRKSHDKMYDLRFVDTTKMERRLRKASDAKTVLSILGLDFSNLVKS